MPQCKLTTTTQGKYYENYQKSKNSKSYAQLQRIFNS